MLKKMLIFSLILATGAFAESIEFSFGNQSNSGTFYEFDIMVRAGNNGTRLGDALIYLNYSTNGFGPRVVANAGIQVNKTGVLNGELIPGLPLYEIVKIVDNADGRVAITTAYLYEVAPGSANALTTTPQPMLHVKLAIVSTAANAGLSFENPVWPTQPTMQRQQYYSDNATKYDPVIATATDNSALTPIAVDLVSFTATPVESGVQLDWQTASEINHAGFNIFRSPENEENHIRLNDALISGKNPQGATYSYLDKPSAAGLYFYKLQAINLDGSASFYPSIKVEFATSVVQDIPLPSEFKLEQNYPNPFNPATRIHYQVPAEAFVQIAIYNIQGRLIRQLVDGSRMPGHHVVMWDGRDAENNQVGAGIYILEMKSLDFRQTKRVTLLR